MTWRAYVLILAVLSLIAGSWWAIVCATTPPAPFQDEVLDVVHNAERVRVQRMLPMDGTPPPGAAFYENCSLVGTGKAIEPPKGWLADFQDIITDGRTYGAAEKAGTPNPKIVIRFVKGGRRIDIMLAFDVDTVVVQCDGSPCGTGIFTSRRKDLVQLVKQLFPHDGEIQAISEV